MNCIYELKKEEFNILKETTKRFQAKFCGV